MYHNTRLQKGRLPGPYLVPSLLPSLLFQSQHSRRMITYPSPHAWLP